MCNVIRSQKDKSRSGAQPGICIGGGAVLETGNNIKRSWPRFLLVFTQIESVFKPKFRCSQKKKDFIQAETQFFWSISDQVFDQFSSQIPLRGQFSFLVQKSTSKVLKTGYFAYSSGQWGGLEPPTRPLATLLVPIAINRFDCATSWDVMVCRLINPLIPHNFLFLVSWLIVADDATCVPISGWKIDEDQTKKKETFTEI